MAKLRVFVALILFGSIALFRGAIESFILGIRPNKDLDPPNNKPKDDHVYFGIRARVFNSWNGTQLPCFDPGKNWKADMSATDSGILFTKNFKTGSSTGAGITLRVSRNQARRQNRDFPICKARFNHVQARVLVPKRDPTKSFLWTIVRDPIDRIVSSFFFIMVSRRKNLPTDEKFMEYVERGSLKDGVYMNGGKPIREERLEKNGATSHYAYMLSTEPAYLHNNTVSFMNKIMSDYDFIGVTERMDETAVALSMLLNVPLADVLYLSAKSNGFDGGGYQNKCTYIIPPQKSPGMVKFFQTPDFQERIRWDNALHQAANKSLDLTIDKLGPARFKENLYKFREALQTAEKECQPTAIYPCSFKGGDHPSKETDCIWKDSGCGYKCLDHVATNLNLWGPGGPLTFPENEKF